MTLAQILQQSKNTLALIAEEGFEADLLRAYNNLCVQEQLQEFINKQ